MPDGSRSTPALAAAPTSFSFLKFRIRLKRSSTPFDRASAKDRSSTSSSWPRERNASAEEIYLDKASRRLGGIAYQVASDIVQHIDLEIRVTVLGHIQRGGSPIAFDRILATRFGAAAADLVLAGDFGKMVALRGEDIVPVSIKDAVSNPKYVDPAGAIVHTARSVGISFGDDR